MDFIDLRSDTVTRPSPAMRHAMAEAPVGDDQYGDDPSINLLQERLAQLLGKEAALFVPSGTMANQIGLKLLTHPGDDVVLGHETHMVWHESGAGAANAGVQFTPIGSEGLFTANEFRAALKPAGHMMFPPTSLVVVENTHNRCGGLVFPQNDAIAICEAARALGIRTYLDGARLFNAAAASGCSVAELARPFEVVSIALSKGLGCPVGSVIAGPANEIMRAVRVRRMFGGAMRQAGILAAAGLYALEHNLARLPEDHAHARLIAEHVAKSPGVRLNLATVQSNIVIFHMEEGAPDAATIAARAKENGVLLSVFGARKLRAVTHLDVSGADCQRAADILTQVIARG
ncbi:MAG TPA: GntG family PLP-dependent aldolase [Micropepsaceae bacterium]|jgi:threonine aldolase|nr:GntG family PLP-dependent aldolase [Micropepsaceae bacterium]